MGDQRRKVVYATDERVNTNYPTRLDPDVQEKPAEPSDIDFLFGSISFFIPSKFAAVLKYHMNQAVFDNDVERKFFTSLNIIIDHGTYADRQQAMVTLGESEKAWRTTVGSTNGIAIQCGAKFQMDDCDTYRCAFCPLVFIAHNFGEWLKISC